MARLIPENSSNHAVSNNAELFGTRGALNQLPVGMMILSALIALPLTIADSQMLDCIVPTGFFTQW